MQDAALPPAKARMRQAVRERRAALFEADRLQASRTIAQLAVTLLADRAEIVCAYWALPEEVDCKPLFVRLAERGQPVCLPATLGDDQPLSLRLWEPEAALYPAGFGTLAPEASAREVVPDVMILPLLAFDARGTRLGYGGGHYDRTIAALPKRPFLVGLAFACQEVPLIEREAHDIPLDAVVTENGVRRFADGAA